MPMMQGKYKRCTYSRNSAQSTQGQSLVVLCAGSVAPAELTALADALHEASPGCCNRNTSLIQLARAAVAASEGPAAAKYDLMRRQSSALEMAVQEGAILCFCGCIDQVQLACNCLQHCSTCW